MTAITVYDIRPEAFELGNTSTMRKAARDLQYRVTLGDLEVVVRDRDDHFYVERIRKGQWVVKAFSPMVDDTATVEEHNDLFAAVSMTVGRPNLRIGKHMYRFWG